MKRRLVTLICCMGVACITTVGLLVLLNQTAQAVPNLAVEQVTAREPDTTHTTLVDSSSGGFTVTPSSLSVTILSGETLSRVFTVTRMTGGAPGSCNGHIEISGTQLVLGLYQDELSQQSQALGVAAVRLSINWFDGYGTSYKVGDGASLHDSETGITDFMAADDPQFNDAVSKFTDGADDWVVLDWDLFDSEGYPHGGGSQMRKERIAFGTEADLAGHSIDMIRRNVTGLTIQPANGYSFDVTWSFWEYLGTTSPYWMWAMPAFDDLAIGASRRIDVTFAAMELMTGTTLLPPGVYTSTILVDPGESCAPPHFHTDDDGSRANTLCLPAAGDKGRLALVALNWLLAPSVVNSSSFRSLIPGLSPQRTPSHRWHLRFARREDSL